MKCKALEIVNHNDGSYGLMFTSKEFYRTFKDELPENLQLVTYSCHVDDWYSFKKDLDINELLNWFNSRGIDVIVRSCVYNPKYKEG